jgi:hypothetical protein
MKGCNKVEIIIIVVENKDRTAFFIEPKKQKKIQSNGRNTPRNWMKSVFLI